MGCKMKKSLLVCMVMALSFAAAAADNLIENGDFNGADFKSGWYLRNNLGQAKVTPVTEDLTWNKCIKFEVAAFAGEPGARCHSSELVFGRVGKIYGVPVKPDTVYNFSFEIKGNRGVAIWAVLDDNDNPSEWSGKGIRPTPPGAKGTPDAWSRVSGSFKTASDTKRVRLRLQFWMDEKSAPGTMGKIGDYVLIDNVVIEEKPTLNHDTPIPPQATARPAATLPDEFSVGFAPLKSGPAALPAMVNLQGDANALTCIVTIKTETANNTVPAVIADGMDIWRDNVVELFFAPMKPGYTFTQFAMASGGGRYRATGAGREDGVYEQWTGKVEKAADTLRYTFHIPWTLAGFKQRPEDGTALGFNLGVKQNNINYSWSPVKTGFGDVLNFGTLIFGAPAEYRRKTAAQLEVGAPEQLKPEIAAFAKGNSDAATAVAAALLLSHKINAARLGTSPFIAATLPLTGKFFAPLEIGPENVIQSPIKLRAARNETAVFPLVIMNRTAQTAAYRVLVHADAGNFNTAEITGLTNRFPAGRIILREAVSVKDGDDSAPGRIFDPLPRMNEAQTITVAAQESGLVWVEFDCANVAAGTYAGSIRVIPLNESAKLKRHDYQGKLRDYPLTLEVLPFTLQEPRTPGWLCGGVVNRAGFDAQRALGARYFHLIPWAFPFRFMPNGDLIDGPMPDTEAHIRQIMDFYRQSGAETLKPKILIGFSTYSTFAKHFMPKTIKPLSREWENCWRNNLKGIRRVLERADVAPDEVVFELFDEPKGQNFEEYLAATKIARETLPDALLEVTWGPANFGFTSEMIAQFIPYLDEHIFHWLLLGSPDYAKLIKKIQADPTRKTGMYQCSTSIRESLHNYFRLHPWRTRNHNFDILGFYVFNQSPWGQPGAPDWKITTKGAISYRADEFIIPSIRLAAFRRGLDDIRYLDLLEPYRNQPEVAKFLDAAPKRVIAAAHDPAMPDRIRTEAIALLTKYATPQVP